MEGRRAIQDEGLQLGRPQPEADLRQLHAQAQSRAEGGGGGSKLSSWFGRLTGGGGRSGRRGSIGFTAEINHAPPARMDEDSNSGMEVTAATAPQREASGGLGFRRRDVSFSDIQTPGGDGDTFVFQYKRRNSSTPDFSLLHSPPRQESGPEMLLQVGSSDGLSAMQPIIEGHRLQISQDTAAEAVHHEDQTTPYHLMRSQDHKTVKEGGGDGSSIFLIDLEPMEEGEGAGLVLKPKSKKFSASKLFQTKLTQNWFFRNGEDETAASDGYKESRGGEGTPSRKTSADESREGAEDMEDDAGLTFFGKFQRAVDQQPRRLKEMNTWQPQGH